MDLELTPEELTQLRICVRHVVASACIPEWEFETLVGCSPAEARSWADAGSPAAKLEEGWLDQVVAMLSLLAGSAQAGVPAAEAEAGVGREELDRLLEKLCWSPAERRGRSPHQSAVTLRAHPSAVGQRAEAVTPARRHAARKRRA